MNKSIVKYIFFTLLILFFQVAILNSLNISYYILPMAYPIVIFSLMRSINSSLLLLAGFGLGLIMDVFSNTGGAHSIACTVIAYIRPFFLSSLGPMDMGSEQIKPSILNFGAKNYGFFIFLLLLIHHVLFFFLEAFSMSNILSTFYRILGSLIFSWSLIMGFQYLFASKEK